MASTRLIYDKCYCNAYNKDTKSQLDYQLYDGKYNHSAKCLLDLGQIGGHGVSVFSGNLIDLESDLRGQTRPLSLCPDMQYKPKCSSISKKDGIPCEGYMNSQLKHNSTCRLYEKPFQC